MAMDGIIHIRNNAMEKRLIYGKIQKFGEIQEVVMYPILLMMVLVTEVMTSLFPIME